MATIQQLPHTVECFNVQFLFLLRYNFEHFFFHAYLILDGTAVGTLCAWLLSVVTVDELTESPVLMSPGPRS